MPPLADELVDELELSELEEDESDDEELLEDELVELDEEPPERLSFL